MLGLIVTIVIVGLVAGALARLLVPGKQHLSIAMTIVLGVIRVRRGGFLGYLIFHKDAPDGFLQPSGIIGSVIGAVIVVDLDSCRRTQLDADQVAPPEQQISGSISPASTPTMVRAF